MDRLHNNKNPIISQVIRRSHFLLQKLEIYFLYQTSSTRMFLVQRKQYKNFNCLLKNKFLNAKISQSLKFYYLEMPIFSWVIMGQSLFLNGVAYNIIIYLSCAFYWVFHKIKMQITVQK